MKNIFIWFVFILVTACSSLPDVTQELEDFEANQSAFEDVLEDIDSTPFIDRDVYLSLVELNSVRDDFTRVQFKIVEAQKYLETQKELIAILQGGEAKEETQVYFKMYLESLNYYDTALVNYSQGLYQLETYLDYAELDIEYDELNEKFWQDTDDFYRYMDLDQYENASQETENILGYLDRQLEIRDGQYSLIPFSFLSKSMELDQLYRKYFATAAERLQEDEWPTEAKVYDAIDDIGDEINVFDMPTSQSIDEEVDQWYFDHVNSYFTNADDYFQDGYSEAEDAEEYLDEDLDHELRFKTFSYAPEKFKG